MGSCRTPCCVPCAPRPVPHAMCSPRPPQPLRNLEEKAENQPQQLLSVPGLCMEQPLPKEMLGEAVAEGKGCLAGLSPCLHTASGRLAARPPCFPLRFHSHPCTLPGVAHGSTQDCFWAPEAGAERGRRRDVCPGWGRAAMVQLNGCVRGFNSQGWIFLSVSSDSGFTVGLPVGPTRSSSHPSHRPCTLP